MPRFACSTALLHAADNSAAGAAAGAERHASLLDANNKGFVTI